MGEGVLLIIIVRSKGIFLIYLIFLIAGAGSESFIDKIVFCTVLFLILSSAFSC